MKKSLFILLSLVLLIVAFIGGARFNQHQAGPKTAGTGNRQILHYVDPMNPAHTSSELGIAPCGMPMEPVYADEDQPGGARSNSPGAVPVSPHKQQVLGVHIDEVTRTTETLTFRAPGRLVVDENRVYVVRAATEGWVGEINDSTTGSLVKANQLLARIRVYSYEFLTWQSRYLSEFRQPRGTGGAAVPLTRRDMARLRYPPPQADMPAAASGSHTPPAVAASAQGAATENRQQPASLPLETPPVPGRSEDRAAAPAPMPMAPPGNANAHAAHHPKTPVAATDVQTMRPGAAPMGRPQPGITDEELAAQNDTSPLSWRRGRLELLNLGVEESQLQEMTTNGTQLTHVDLRSPVDGYVLARNISPRQKIDNGTECFRIADLSKVWIEASLHDPETSRLRPGMQARVNLPGQTQQFTATVSHTLPRFDATSRSFRVRLEMDNPGLVFRPEMFVDVEFQIPLPAAVSVPTGAVIDTGRRKTVYAMVGEGLFAPREVQTGWRTGDRVEIVRGLQPGEKIAVSGTFLLDSESRMRLAAAGLMTDQPATAPAVAPQPAAAQPAPTVPVAAQPVAKPDTAAPAQPAAPSEPPAEPVVSEAAVVPPLPPALAAAQAENQADKVKDPVCGMVVDPQQARADGLTFDVAGVTHFFCSEACKQQFQENPSRFTSAPAGAHAHDLPPDHGKGAHD
jgi:RND family efflux transporter MFP subunit